MFTGIIKNIGTVTALEFQGPVARLNITAAKNFETPQPGDSIAVNGVCLTVTQIEHHSDPALAFDLGPETLEKTCLSALRATEKVHLELAMRLSDRISGHLVQGHVDGIGIIVEKQTQGDALYIRIATNKEILAQCIHKGSIAVDGVSLTINQIVHNSFEICLIPHTIQTTCLASYPIGHRVNLETDMIGKYVLNLRANANDTRVSVTN